MRFVRTTTDMPSSACPACRAAADCATSLEGHRPSPGDLTVCLSCGAVATYGASMQLVPVDVATLSDETRASVLDMQRKVARVRPS